MARVTPYFFRPDVETMRLAAGLRSSFSPCGTRTQIRYSMTVDEKALIKAASMSNSVFKFLAVS